LFITQRTQTPEIMACCRCECRNVERSSACGNGFETSGVDPLTNDAASFRERYLRRILKNRVWILMKRDRLVFKTDLSFRRDLCEASSTWQVKMISWSFLK
jgi:hypothetical protein